MIFIAFIVKIMVDVALAIKIGVGPWSGSVRVLLTPPALRLFRPKLTFRLIYWPSNRLRAK